MEIKAFVWDMGGVLLRTEDGSPRERLAGKFNLSRYELESLVFSSESSHQAERGIITAEEHWQTVKEYLNLDSDQLAEFINAFWAGDQMDHTLVSFVDHLRPRYKTGLISNAWSNARSHIDGQHHFLHVFDEVIFSSEVGIRKPHQEIFTMMLDRLGVCGNECVFIDDFPHNLDGAEELGMKTILFSDPNKVMEQITSMIQA